MFEPVLLILALVLMFFGLVLIIVPVVPVAALEWAIAMVFAALTGFQRVTPIVALIMTVLMVIGSTSGFWMPFLGLKGKELSCLGLIGFFAGLIIGGVIIPIPLLGSFIGGIGAVFIIQFFEHRNARKALSGSGTALRLIFYSMVAEFIFAVIIIALFIGSLATTGG